MRCRSRVPLWLSICGLFGLAFSFGPVAFFSHSLLKMTEEIITSDPSKALEVVRVLAWSFTVLTGVKYIFTFLAFWEFVDIRNHIQQVVDKKSLHKNPDKSCGGKVSKCSHNIDKLAELVLWPLCDLIAAVTVVLFSVGFLWHYCLGACVISVLMALTLAIFFMEVLSCRCKESLCFSCSFNANSKLSENIKDPCNQDKKGKIKFSLRSVKDYYQYKKERIKLILRNSKNVRNQNSEGGMKFIFREGTKKFFVEHKDIVYQWLPILTAVSLVAHEVLSPKFLLAAIVLCCCLSDGLCKAAKIFCTFPKMKECIENIRTITEDNESRSESEWRYLYQLLTATGRFGQGEKDCKKN